MLDPAYSIQFGSVFQKKSLDHFGQSRPGSDLDGLVRFWPNAPCPEAGWCARIVGPRCGRMHPTHYQFPTETFTDSQDHIVQNQPRSNLVLTDRQVLAKWIWSRCKPLCKNHLACFRPMLPIQFRCKSDPACLLDCNKCLFILL